MGLSAIFCNHSIERNILPPSSSQLKQTEEYPIDKDYEFFVSPYDDGDGYEMKAVAIDKCRYISFFLARGGHIVVQIDKTVRVKVIYEDRENIKIAQGRVKRYCRS